MIRILFILAAFCLNVVFASGNQLKILSLDGGGIRGAATLKVLKELQKQTHIQFNRDFDVYAGTSTGSIIAISLALGGEIDELLSDYEEMSAAVFSQSHYLSVFRPEYSPEKLKSFLIKALESHGYSANTTLGEIPKKLIIPTVALDDSKKGRWTLKIRENFTKEGGKIKVVDAILESTAAPTYFPSENGCVDGAMAMNDPSLAALMTAYHPDTMDLKNISIFSVGTGYVKEFVKGNESWGAGQWMMNLTGSSEGTVPLVSLLMDVQEQIPEQVCKKLLGKAYLKYDFPLTQSFAIDAYSKMSDLLKYTEKYIKENPKQWSEACLWLNDRF